MFGKERRNKLIGGNGVIEVKLTPAVDQQTTLRLATTVGRIEAEGALGELLRSGSLGPQAAGEDSRLVAPCHRKGD